MPSDVHGRIEDGFIVKDVFKAELAGLRVMVCMPVFRDVSVPTFISYADSVSLATSYNVPVDLQVQWQCSCIKAVRSKCAHFFLKSSATKLFWIDSDMMWSAEAFMRLVALSVKMDIVSGTYVFKQDAPRFMLSHIEGKDIVPNEYGCIPITGNGLGFTIVDRRVIEKLSSFAPMRDINDPECDGPIPHIFETRDKAVGEDKAFFGDCIELGFTPWLDPSIQLGHVGQKIYTASFGDYLKSKEI